MSRKLITTAAVAGALIGDAVNNKMENLCSAIKDNFGMKKGNNGPKLESPTGP